MIKLGGLPVLKILIVDDEKLLRRGFIHITNWPEMGFFIAGEASNGVEALEIIEKTHPDIVITDIRMPLMDGIQLIKEIKAKYESIQIIVLSSYSDFQYVKFAMRYGAIDFILKQEMELDDILNTLKSAKNKIENSKLYANESAERIESTSREMFFDNIASNNLMDLPMTDFHQLKDIFGLEENNLMITIFAVESGNFLDSDTGARFKYYLELLKKELQGIQPEFLLKNLSIFKQQQIVSIYNYRENEREVLKKDFERLIEVFNSNYNLRLWVVNSDLFNGYTSISKVFADTLKLAECTFYYEKGSVIETAIYTVSSEYPEVNFDIVSSFVEKYEFGKLLEWMLHSINEMNKDHQRVEPYLLKKYILEIVYFIKFKFIEVSTGVQIRELEKIDLERLQRLDSSTKYSKMLTELKAFIVEIQRIAVYVRREYHSPVIGAVLTYINNNYGSDLSLASLALQFNISKSYLCKLFKNKTGENVNDYIQKIRIGKAKKLLAQGNLIVNEIASRVGYENTSYFIKIFKQNTGMTPYDYKKSRSNCSSIV
jgi:two-component system response regulator YesN